MASIVAAVRAQDMGGMPMEYGGFDPGAPMTEMGGGGFFSQELGTLFRIRYNTESYGQEGTGNLDLGTMRVANFDDAIGFFDGQLTLNDEQGVGFNLGVGFRWMSWVPMPLEPERITGISVWADGTSTSGGNFFPQVGVSYESLGDMWDLRVNSYIPIGKETQLGAFEPTGDIGFQGNFLSLITVADQFSSFNVGEVEVARRLGAERDAWAFAAPYVLANDKQDTAGYKVGLRGYAYPDLLLQFAVSDDDIFKTNATFSMMWFVGRTRTNFQPACGLPDRMREPVMRNDYVALGTEKVFGGEPLTNTSGTPFRFVHVNSEASGGGNGTFENPYNVISGPNGGGSEAGDIILLYSDSVFDMNNTLVLKNDQRVLGEGNNMSFTINTLQKGVVTIPETSPGARALPRPIIMDALGGGAIQLAIANEVANIEFDGGMTAIFSPVEGAGNPNLHDLEISNTIGDGIVFTPATQDNDDDPTTPQVTVRGNVTINRVTFDNVGGNDININSFTSTDVTSPNTTLQETIAISNITSTNVGDSSLLLQNTHSGRTATISSYTYDGGAGTGGGWRLLNIDGTLNASTSTFTGGTESGIFVGSNGMGSSAGTLTFANTVTINDVDGTAFEIDGVSGNVTMNGAITNDTGRSLSIQRVSGGTTRIVGDITDDTAATSKGVFVGNNTGGTIIVDSDIVVSTTNDIAIQLLNNTGADISFNGDLDITTLGGNGFDASGGGTLTMLGTSNTIDTTGAVGLRIDGMAINNAGVRFEEVNVTTSATNGMLFNNVTGGPITIGTIGNEPGDSGTIADTSGDAISIANTANITITGVEINNSNAVAGVQITKSNTVQSIVNLNDMEINGGSHGINATGGGTGALNLTINDTMINDPEDFGLRFDNVDVGTIAVNDVTLDGDAANPTAVGVEIVGSNATFTFNAGTTIEDFGGTSFHVDGGTPNITMNGDITNSSGVAVHIENTTGGTKTFGGDITHTSAANRSVHIEANTGGSVNFNASSTITDTGQGMLVENNTGGSYSFLGTNDLDPVAAATEAVLVNNNTGANITFAGLNINTATGSTTQGFVATGGGTLSVTGTTNEINTENGTGLRLENMTIGSVDFRSVTVDGNTGPANAIVLNTLTGGQVEIGTTTGAQNSGGMLRTTGDAIVVTNAQNVALRDIQILSAGGRGVVVTHNTSATTNSDVTVDGLNLDASTLDGVSVTAASNANSFVMRLINSDLEENVVVNATGSGLFQMRTEDTTINVTGTTDAFAATISGSAANVDMILSDTDFVADDASALSITTAGGTGKTFGLLVENGSFMNDSTSAAAEFSIGGNTLFNVTIRGNSFDNANVGGEDFYMTSTSAQSRIRLNLGGDDAAEMNTAAGQGDFVLEETLGDFDVFERDDTFNNLRNNGTVVPLPNAAAFDNMLVPPPVPVIP